MPPVLQRLSIRSFGFLFFCSCISAVFIALHISVGVGGTGAAPPYRGFTPTPCPNLNAYCHIHFISPLRDPTFEPNSANRGTLVPWLQEVSESTWIIGGAILALLFAVNLTIVLWLWSRANHSDIGIWFRGYYRRVAHFIFPARWLILWIIGSAYFSYSYGDVVVILVAAVLSVYFVAVF